MIKNNNKIYKLEKWINLRIYSWLFSYEIICTHIGYVKHCSRVSWGVEAPLMLTLVIQCVYERGNMVVCTPGVKPTRRKGREIRSIVNVYPWINPSGHPIIYRAPFYFCIFLNFFPFFNSKFNAINKWKWNFDFCYERINLLFYYIINVICIGIYTYEYNTYKI